MMKKILTTVSFSILLISCNNDITTTVDESLSTLTTNQKTLLNRTSESLNKDYILNADFDEQIFYKKHYLKEAAKIIRDLKVPTKDLLISSLNSDDNTILFNDIIERVRNNGTILNEDIERRITEVNSAFEGLDSEDYNIVFHFPNAEKLSNTDINSEIFVFEGVEDSSQLAFEGEILNNEGYIYEKPITEELAEELVSQGQAIVFVGLSSRGPNSYGGGFSNPNPTSSMQHLNMSEMIVKAHKESWIAGKSEVTMAAVFQKNGGFYNAASFHAYLGWGEYTIANVTRRKVNNQSTVYVDKSVAQLSKGTSPFILSTDNNFALHYVIFEKDHWPTQNRTRTFVHEGSSYTITFRSADAPYDDRTLIGHNIFPTYNNSEIKYTISYGALK